MHISEPMTLLTDYILGAASLMFAIKLAARAEGQESRHWWVGAFLLLTGAGFAGGTWHGFKSQVSATTAGLLWGVTYICIGSANLFFIAGAARALFAERPRRFLRGMLWYALMFTLLGIVLIKSATPVFCSFPVAIVFFFLLALAMYRNQNSAGAKWLLDGALASALAGGLFYLKTAPAPSFNENDLFHVIQTLGLYCLYRGGTFLKDR